MKNSERERNKSRIIWAIDAFSPDLSLQKRVGDFLKGWTKGTGLGIEPVTVIGPDQLNVAATFFRAQSKDIEAATKARLESWLGKSKLSGLLPPTVLTCETRLARHEVSVLVAYAKRTGAEMLAVSTHSRKAVSRFLFGSFAETLLLHSDVPVFIVRPGMRLVSRYQRILFPTDFSDRSLIAFQEVLGVTKRQKAQLILFHQVEIPVNFATLGLHNPILYLDYQEQDRADRKQKIEAMAERARAQGIKVTVIFNERPGDPAQSILTAARKTQAALLALASESGGVAATMLGSIARRVVRHASCPVWIVHPRDNEIVLPAERDPEPRHPSRSAKV